MSRESAMRGSHTLRFERVMATILEIAGLANVSAENVLRVVNGAREFGGRIEGSSSDRNRRPAGRRPVEPKSSLPTAGLVRRQTSSSREWTRWPRTSKHGFPETWAASSMKRFASRSPVSRHIAELDALYQLINGRLEDMRLQIERERHERLEDVALLSELVSAGWRSADRRLARMERMLTRLEEAIGGERNPLQVHSPRPLKERRLNSMSRRRGPER